jgi:hypothetical protein
MDTFGTMASKLCASRFALISIVFKDNPAYRFAEHTYVGL